MTPESIRAETDRGNAAVFHTDTESLSKENQRLERNLAQALEERNRLLKKLNRTVAGAGHGGDSRILDQQLEELRMELLRQRRENRQLEEEKHRLQEWTENMEKYQGLLLERLEGLAESHADEEQAETQPGDPQGSGQQDAAVRFDAAIRGIWRRLDDKKNLMDGVQSHEITRLRTTVRKRQTELTAATRERNELTGRVDDLQGKLQEREASLGERERENAELTSELAAIRKEKERLETTVAGLQLRIRRLRSGRGLRGLRLRARAAVDRRLGPGLRGHVVTTALILIGCACGIALALLVQRSLSDPPQTLPAVPPPAVQLPATGD